MGEFWIMPPAAFLVWASRHAGRVLVVSSYKLDKQDEYLSAIIRESGFEPEKIPGREERNKLIASKAYQRQKPHRWEDIASEHPGKHDKWLKIMGLKHISFETPFYQPLRQSCQFY